MPKKTKPETKPLYPLVHEYRDSIERGLQEAAMLLNVCETLLELDQIKSEGAKAKLVERCASFRRAFYDETQM